MLGALTGCTSDGLADDEAGTTTSVGTTEDSSTTSSSSGSEMTTSEVTDDDSVDMNDDQGITFVDHNPDFVGGPKPCDPFAQDCPDGEKCVPYAARNEPTWWYGNKCVPVLGDSPPGTPCTSGGILEATDDCDGTSFCWDVVEVDGEEIGVCAAFCTGTPDDPTCDQPGTSCLIRGDGGVTLCTATCDPLNSDCGPGFGCYWSGLDFNCALTTSGFPLGEPCGFINDCAAGSYCAEGAEVPDCMGAACCTPFCDLNNPVCLLAGTECVAFFEQDMAPPEYAQLGICLIPA